MNTKPFPLAVVLSITTGRLCCDIGSVYEILNHITGDNLFTHVLPRAGEFAKPLLLEDFPELSGAGLSKLDAMLDGARERGDSAHSAVATWLESLPLSAQYDVKSYADRWLSFDPLAELSSMVGPEKVMITKP